MDLKIRTFETEKDTASVESLFITVNRMLAPPAMEDRFEAYIKASIDEEIGQIETYYATKIGQFWVAYQHDILIGMVGIEQQDNNTMELRRMYVSPNHRRKGIAHKMLDFVENWCRNAGVSKMVLSTSELQPAAISFYEMSGYQLTDESSAKAASNKTIGGGIRRRYYSKML
ncbi:MAG: GNAT family N-acetyltransferase [Amylibacter sp.]